jgi:two-component system cell cycle response regulator
MLVADLPIEHLRSHRSVGICRAADPVLVKNRCLYADMTYQNQGSPDLLEFERPGSACSQVLVAEDDAMFRTILQSWLGPWGYRVTLAEDGAKAWTILQQEHPPQVLILDWMMPEINGLDLCRKVREQNRHPYQYILLATAKDAKQDLVRGLEAGADDYLTKPFDRSELRARLRACNRILSLQEGQMLAQEQLRFQATHDPLTGVWNRGAILETLRRELERSARTQSATGLLMLDIDHFKKINDTHGHLTGDAALKEVTHRILNAVRTYDSVGRYGGEEFLIVLPGCGREELDHGAERIRSAVDSGPMLLNGATLSITVSLGAAVTTGAAISDLQMLAAVDSALYRAKEIGRNRTVRSDLVFN